ncbi:MAG: carboxypeptidase-like regulatory domain-containing protein [Candidatus Eremiobacteraeota bacterium]|nr:carboxypeptidase-like regulatory domain-containing protein [Candidatus Eremiobacteraeota bacterium]MCL5055395.1 carboxypeptidase-like regulatory domain-containing protein [Bacillota bacterium]
MRKLFFLLLLILPGLQPMAQTISGFSPAYVEGHITADGKPLGGAKIDVMGAVVSKKTGKVSSYTVCGEGFVLSSSNGNYAVGLSRFNTCGEKNKPNPNYLIKVSKRGYLSQEKLVSFGKFDIVQKSFVLSPSNSEIQVQITGPGGKIVPYAYVILTKNVVMTSGAQILKTRLFSVASETPIFRADKNGEVTIPVSPGDYIVTAQKLGYQLATRHHNPLADAACREEEQKAALFGISIRNGKGCGKHLYPGDFVHLDKGTIRDASLVLVPQTAPSFSMPKGYQEYLKHLKHLENQFKTMPKTTFIPDQFILMGTAMVSPNNVFFLKLKRLSYNSQGALIGLLRSSLPLNMGNKSLRRADVKFFNPLLYGEPSSAAGWKAGSGINPSQVIYSFTDSTAAPGRAYYYYVGEVPYSLAYGIHGSANFKLSALQKVKPSSNAVEIVTR